MRKEVVLKPWSVAGQTNRPGATYRSAMSEIEVDLEELWGLRFRLERLTGRAKTTATHTYNLKRHRFLQKYQPQRHHD